MKLIQLTELVEDLKPTTLTINTDHILYFHKRWSDKTALYLSSGFDLWVKETPEEIRKRIKEA